MKKLISSTISFITSAALLMCAGFGAMAAENTEEYIDPAFSETELLLGDLDTSLKLPEYPAVDSTIRISSTQIIWQFTTPLQS